MTAFEIQVSKTRNRYSPIASSENADSIIYRFINHLNSFDTIRIIRSDGKVMARKTPKGSFIAPEWRV